MGTLFTAALFLGLVIGGVLVAWYGSHPGTPNGKSTHAPQPGTGLHTDTQTSTHNPSPPPKPYIVPVGRSPLVQPGEKLTTLLPPTRLDLKSTKQTTSQAPAPQAGQTVPWGQAGHYIGQTVTVEGLVVDTHRTDTVCFLNFTKQWRGQFYIIIFKDSLNVWPQPPEKYFLNKTLHITGEIKEHDGRPQIQVHDPSQIKIAD